jgi:hypothetical protein
VASWIDSPLGARVFFPKESVRAGAGAAQSPFHWVSGLKRLERETDCAPLSNAGVENLPSPISLLKRQISREFKEAVSGPNTTVFSQNVKFDADKR